MHLVFNKCKLCRNKLVLYVKFPFARLQFSTRHNSSFTIESGLDPAYVPSKLEEVTYENDYFVRNKVDLESFRMILPPPNITGNLHLGHALTATIQDIVVRWKNMQGIECVWVPGVDHAGIATQVVVEKRLWQEKHQTRRDIGREQFQDEVWKWKKEKADVIGQQLQRLRVSLDWKRQVFTMDEIRSRAVTEAFTRLFEADKIYRADKLVNWSCQLQSAISDIEVEHLNIDGPTKVSVPGYDKPIQFGVLVHFAYKFHNSDEEIVVATTRPETMLGDVAVAVNPQDDRYSRYVGRYLWHPFRQQAIPIICDSFVDPNFGTGAVKVTPAHDHTDFEAGKRHGLEVLQVIDERGNLTGVGKEFSGMQRFDGRNIVLAELERLNLLRGRQDHPMIVPICSRSKDIIEFLVRPQWFVKSEAMAQRALEDVRNGNLIIDPKHFEKTWFNWLENIRDWCISRQLWWGHRIPAYLCHSHDEPASQIWIVAENLENAKRKAAAQLKTSNECVTAIQDEDVLDTWFSSALMPFSVFGWPHQSADLSKYYPLSMMETGHDILFFWVARMVMLGKELTGQLPFNRVLLHGIICDAQGRKMSKSLGNVIAPEDVISGSTLQKLESGSKATYEAGILSQDELNRAIQGQKKMFPQGIPECGADALRFTLVSHNIKNHFINFDVNECYTNKLFCNKIWQATKFTKLWFENILKDQTLTNSVEFDALCNTDKWILSRLSYMVSTVNESMDRHDFHVATAALKNFLYYEFCDIYLETTKRGLRNRKSDAAAGHCWTLITSLECALRALAPFMPVLTQHLHRHLPDWSQAEKRYDFPQNLPWRNETLEKDMEDVMKVVVAIRRLKKIFNIVAKHQPEACIVTSIPLYSTFLTTIQDLSSCSVLNVCQNLSDATKKRMVRDSVGDVEVYMILPEELRRSIELDMPKINKKKEKLVKELDRLNKMVAGDAYKIKATLDAQESNNQKIATLEEKIARINYIQSLSNQ